MRNHLLLTLIAGLSACNDFVLTKMPLPIPKTVDVDCANADEYFYKDINVDGADDIVCHWNCAFHEFPTTIEQPSHVDVFLFSLSQENNTGWRVSAGCSEWTDD